MAIYLKQAVSESVIEVTVKKTMEPKQDQFGKTKFSAIVNYNGQEMWADFAEKFVGIITAGTTVIGIRKEYQGKPYYEWAVKNNLSEKKANIAQDAKEVFIEGQKFITSNAIVDGSLKANFTPMEQPRQDIQDRIIRGMCFNNACTILSKKVSLSESITAKDILELSQDLYSLTKEWLEGKD